MKHYMFCFYAMRKEVNAISISNELRCDICINVVYILSKGDGSLLFLKF